MSSVDAPSFFIKSGNVGFSNRQRDIFDKLNAAEKEKNDRHEENPAMDIDESATQSRREIFDVTVRTRKRRRAETKQFQGKESIFKRPDALPPRFKVRDIPDYQRNPHKWVKYSLGDVSSEDMSERSNTAAALAFLREVEARKNQSMEEDSKSTNILFKAKARVSTTQDQIIKTEPTDTDDCKPLFRSSKLIMPEYVVGQHKKKHTKNKKSNAVSECSKPQKEIKLLHLMDDEDE